MVYFGSWFESTAHYVREEMSANLGCSSRGVSLLVNIHVTQEQEKEDSSRI